MFYKKYHFRIKLLLLIFILLLFLIVFRVFYIQVFEYKKLNTLANDLWSRDLVIEADRGKIIDRNGVVLADNLTTASLIVVPNQIKDKENTAKKIANILDVDYSEILSHLSKNVSIERIHPEGRRLSTDVVNNIEDLKLDGVYLVKEAKRYYPYKDFLAHTLGYVGIDNQGLAGIELQYDSYLKGTNGKIKYYSDAHGNRLETSDVYIAPTAGMNIQLTIDFRIQESLEREMDNIYEMFNPDMALAIVVNPKTGEVLGMSSYPDYDPNNYKKYSSEVLSRNLPIWASYEPGSTFKIVKPIFSLFLIILNIINW